MDKEYFAEKIGEWFERLGYQIAKFRWPILIIALLIGIFCAIGLMKIKMEVTIDNFFLDKDPIMVAKNEFKEIFGNNDFIGILVDAEDVFSYKNLKLIRKLGNELKREVPFADKLISLTDFSFMLISGKTVDVGKNEIPSDRDEVEVYRKNILKLKNVHGRLYSKDYKQAWIILRLKKYPPKETWDKNEEPAMYVGRKVMEIVEKYRADGHKITPTGIPVLAFRKNIEMFEEMKRVLLLASVIALIFIIFLIKYFNGIIGTIFVVICSINFVFGWIGWFGIPSDTNFMLVPMLLSIAVSIGYTIHVTNFYRLFIKRTGNRKEAVASALRETGWPVMFTAGTTIAALMSFMLVPIKTVRWVGLTAAVSVFVVLVYSIIFYGAVLAVGKNKKPDPEYKEKGIGGQERFFIRLSEWVRKRSRLILILYSIFIAILIVGTFYVRVDLNVRKMMGLKLPHIKDQIYVGESKAGSMYSYDIAIKFPEKDMVKDSKILIKLDKLAEYLSNEKLIKRTTSICDNIKTFHFFKNEFSDYFYRVPRANYLIKDYLNMFEVHASNEIRPYVNKDYTMLRIFVEVSDYSTHWFENHLKRVEDKIAELYPEEEYPGVSFSFIGNLIQFSIMNQYVTKGQILSFGFALIVITILMMIVLGNFRLGLIAMIPNISPALVASGFMGFAGAPLEFVTMTIAPMVLGLAVDNTIHFFSHSKLEYFRTGDYNKAIQNTYVNVGGAVTYTTLIICVTFAAFITSKVNNMINMGIYTIAAIAAALVADLFVTPTLIRVTKPFYNNKNK